MTEQTVTLLTLYTITFVITPISYETDRPNAPLIEVHVFAETEDAAVAWARETLRYPEQYTLDRIVDHSQ